jgi:flagellar biosynthetic protein FliR
MMEQSTIIAWLLTLTRVSGFVALWAPMANQSVPHAVRVGLVLALTMFFAPPSNLLLLLSSASAMDNLPLASLMMASAFELLIGASLAWLLSLCLLPTRIAGAVFSQEIGQSGVPVPALSGETSSGPLAQLFDAIGMLMFFVLDLHLWSLVILAMSFNVIPLGSGPWLPSSNEAVARVTFAVESGFASAGPLIVLSTLVLIAVLFANRVAPQFHFFTLVLPLRSLLGLLLALLTIPITIYGLAEAMTALAR